MATDWQRSLVILASTVLTAAVVAVLFWARSLLIPIALAIFLTFVLSPLVSWLQRRGLGRTFSVILVVSVVLLGFIGVGGVIAQQVIKIVEILAGSEGSDQGKSSRCQRMAIGERQQSFW